VDAVHAPRDPDPGALGLGLEVGEVLRIDTAAVPGDPLYELRVLALRPLMRAPVLHDLLGERSHLVERGVGLLGRETARGHAPMIRAPWRSVNARRR
jgi:hypothetical protein